MAKLPSHRILALRRGESEGFLRLGLEVDREVCLTRLRGQLPARPRATRLARDFDAGRWSTPTIGCWRPRSRSTCACSSRSGPTPRPSACSPRTCATCCWRRPWAAGACWRSTPGFRTGCKTVALDETGKLLDNGVIYPHEPQRQVDGARKEIGPRWCAKHKI